MNLAIVSLLSFLITSTTPSQLVGRAIAENPNFIIKEEKNVILDAPFIHQVDNLPKDQRALIRGTACGPSAITMVLKHLGSDIELMDVINKLPNSVYVKGDRFYNLTKAAEIFSKKAVSFENSPENIYNVLNSGHPVILNVQNYDGITGHAVVVVGIMGYEDNSAVSLIVHDPFVGAYRKFDYINNHTLRQPEGYVLPIGIMQPFYMVNDATI